MLHRIPKMIDRSYPQVCLHETPFYTCEEFPINVAWSRLGQPTLKMTCATASPALRLRFACASLEEAQVAELVEEVPPSETLSPTARQGDGRTDGEGGKILPSGCSTCSTGVAA